ncbi:endonuclease/exonuclease/phosphatase family protein [Vannielia sp.]|uniref:endonuclease/exonuclease/phosphatase family protein n=1 Tax=Vannielia sp. TaxID=2813045 RepID=UPI00260C164F|nr:endonuclease/exonuclease/phosphatase family protein [Vannielia sp.]MDF1873911.1 endonuclease/exonuclease/phosphatase family protein [Vannielia sp.]
MAILKSVFWLVAVAGFSAIALSFSGQVWAWGDSLAVGRSWLALAGVVWVISGLVLGGFGRRAGLVMSLVLLAVLAPIGWAKWRPEPAGPGDLAVYQKNMLYALASFEALEADIRAAGADFVTLQEVDPDNLGLLERLSDAYPHWHFCPFYQVVGGVSVASKRPLLESRCGLGYAAAKVEGPGGPLWVVSLHLYWPAPRGQWAQIAEIIPQLQRLDAPVLMAGDFNMVPWSSAVARLEAATKTHRVGRARISITQFGGKLRLPIDHVLAPETWRGRTEIRPRAGSDHKGVLMHLTLEDSKAR